MVNLDNYDWAEMGFAKPNLVLKVLLCTMQQTVAHAGVGIWRLWAGIDDKALSTQVLETIYFKISY